jgi:hypothetical protein
MSDFRDPRDPSMPYGYDRDAVRRMQAEAYGGVWGFGPIIGLLLLLGVMFFAFSGSDYPRVATNETTPAATEPSTTPTPPAQNPGN